MESTARARVEIPVQDVWSVLVDHQGMSSWGPGVSVTLDQPGEQERNGVGAVRRIGLPGPAPDIVEEIRTCASPRVLGYRALSGVPFRGYAGEVVLHPRGASTEIVWTLYADPSWPGDRLVLALVVRGLLRGFTRALRRR